MDLVFYRMSSFQEKVTASILNNVRARRKSASTVSGALPVRASDRSAPAKLREASFADFGGVAALKKKWGMAADSIENWERLWRHNPALARSHSERPIGWVLEADGAIVGYLGNISLLYHLGDRVLTSVAGHGLVVEPVYRAYAVSLIAAFYRQRFVDLYLGTSAIPEVGRIARAFQCDDLRQPDYAKVLFWVLRPDSFTQDLVERLGIKPTLARASILPVSMAIGIDRLLRRRLPGRALPTLEVSEISVQEIGDDFQSLWIEKRQKDPRLFGDRTPAVLRWHFEIPGDQGSACVLCCRKEGKLLGYAVVRNDLQPSGLRKSVVADLFALQDDAEVVKALLNAAHNHAKLGGSYVLELVGLPSNIRRVVSLSNPYTRTYPGCPFHYKAADRKLHEALSDGDAWYASPFDGDATLIRPSFTEPVSHLAAEQCSANVCV